MTWNTDASYQQDNKSVAFTNASSKLETKLNFLAKQLELERLRREKLEKEVVTMQDLVTKTQNEGDEEVKLN